MNVRKLVFGLALPILSVAVPYDVAATSFVALRPHDPARPCLVIKSAVEEMTGQKPPGAVWPIYYSDEFGAVDYEEQEAFVRSFTFSEGHKDKSLIQLTYAWPVGKRSDDKARALYVIGLERDKWHNEREKMRAERTAGFAKRKMLNQHQES